MQFTRRLNTHYKEFARKEFLDFSRKNKKNANFGLIAEIRENKSFSKSEEIYKLQICRYDMICFGGSIVL